MQSIYALVPAYVLDDGLVTVDEIHHHGVGIGPGSLLMMGCVSDFSMNVDENEDREAHDVTLGRSILATRIFSDRLGTLKPTLRRCIAILSSSTTSAFACSENRWQNWKARGLTTLYL